MSEMYRLPSAGERQAVGIAQHGLRRGPLAGKVVRAPADEKRHDSRCSQGSHCWRSRHGITAASRADRDVATRMVGVPPVGVSSQLPTTSYKRLEFVVCHWKLAPTQLPFVTNAS